MPTAPRRPCPVPGCPELIGKGERRCAKHAAEYTARDRERWRRANRRRGSAASRGYGPRWRRVRAAYLRSHPVCVMCGAQAVVVDHIVPHRGDMRLFWNHDNWQPLCKACHSRKTAETDGGFGNSGGGRVESLRSARENTMRQGNTHGDEMESR